MLKQIALLCAALFLVLHPKANAQQGQQATKEVVTDSFFVTLQTGQYFATNIQTYTDGSAKSETTRLGDSLTTYRIFLQYFANEAARMANDVNVTSRYRNVVTERIRYGNSLKTLLGRSPLDSLRNSKANLYETGWRVLPRTGSAGVNLRFRVTGAGTFQWRADTMPTNTWRAATFLGKIIRLNNFNGEITDFYEDTQQPGRWVTLNRSHRLAEPGATQAATSRNALDAPPTDEAPADAPLPPPYRLNPDGTVSVVEGGRIVNYKYATKNRVKQWVKQP